MVLWYCSTPYRIAVQLSKKSRLYRDVRAQPFLSFFPENLQILFKERWRFYSSSKSSFRVRPTTASPKIVAVSTPGITPALQQLANPIPVQESLSSPLKIQILSMASPTQTSNRSVHTAHSTTPLVWRTTIMTPTALPVAARARA